MANAAIEAKVRASTAVAGVLGLAVTLLNSVGTDSALLKPLPVWLQSIVTLLAPPVAVLLAGWIAPHSPRLDPVPAAPALAAPAAAPVLNGTAPAPAIPVTPVVPLAVTDPASGA